MEQRFFLLLIVFSPARRWCSVWCFILNIWLSKSNLGCPESQWLLNRGYEGGSGRGVLIPHSRVAARKTTVSVSHQKSYVSFFFSWRAVPSHELINFTFSVLNGSSRPCFERQFPAMNMLILLFLFWMAVPGHEHNLLIILLLLLLHFYFYFHFIIKMFCFVLKNKKWIYFQFNETDNNSAFYFHFIFNSK